MTKMGEEMECIARLEVLTPVWDSMLEFMIAEDLISKEDRRACGLAQDKAKWLWQCLNTLSKTKKIQLLEYEWVILPVERIKILMITDRNQKEFSFGY